MDFSGKSIFSIFIQFLALPISISMSSESNQPYALHDRSSKVSKTLHQGRFEDKRRKTRSQDRCPLFVVYGYVPDMQSDVEEE